MPQKAIGKIALVCAMACSTRSVAGFTVRPKSIPFLFCRQEWQRKPWRIWNASSSLHSALSLPEKFQRLEEEAKAVQVPRKFNPYPFSYRQEIQVKIMSLTNRGWGIARVPLGSDIDVEQNNGEAADDSSPNDQKRLWVVMIPSVIPGEIVIARVFRNHKSYSEADVVSVLQTSPHRKFPPCPVAAECGGCQLQHLTIEKQREWKTLWVQEALDQHRVKLTEHVLVKPCLGTDEIHGYRSKLTPHYQRPVKSRQGQEERKVVKEIGFQSQTSRRIVDVPSCLIATPQVNDSYKRIRKQLLDDPPQGKKGATLLLRQANLGDDYVETNNNEYLTTTVKNLNFTYRAGNFFQNNYYLLPLLVDDVTEYATKPSRQTGETMTHLADCYCGSGLFALSLSARLKRVVGIEINEQAIAEATANARANQIGNCEFKAASAESIFDAIQDFPRERSVVVLDPPRKGCSEEFLEQLYEFAPSRIVYMSCEPVTQARDAAGIVEAGYEISLVQPYDLFPQTRHIECLMVFERY